MANAKVWIGYHCSHEQHSPRKLLACLKEAEKAGFMSGMCSDHLKPWREDQGHSGYAWSWLGAALEGTSLELGTVCCPLFRYHPVIIAQAMATLAGMYPGRIWAALGSGEALNEAVFGSWPEKKERHERLLEAAALIRKLWRSEEASGGHYYRVERAKIYSLPDRIPRLYGAALSPETAAFHGTWADGLITVAAPREKLEEIKKAFEDAGGKGKPLLLQSAISFARDEADAERAALERWPQAGLDRQELAELSDPRRFEELSRKLTVRDIEGRIRISADIGRHLDWIEEDCSLGFERIYLHNVHEDQAYFIERFGREIIRRWS